MAVRIAAGRHDRGDALLGDRQEMVLAGSGADRVDRDLDVPSVPFLKPTGIERPEASSRWTWLSRRARADRAPGDEVGEELRRDRVEELAAGREPQLRHAEQEAARAVEPLADREAAVEVGVVDQPLPADRRARLLEVDAHHDAEVGGEFALDLGEPPRVLEAGLGIVDRARPDDHDAVDRPRPRRTRSMAARPPQIVSFWASLTGRSSIRISGGIRGRMCWIRTSSSLWVIFVGSSRRPLRRQRGPPPGP